MSTSSVHSSHLLLLLLLLLPTRVVDRVVLTVDG